MSLFLGQGKKHIISITGYIFHDDVMTLKQIAVID